MQSFVSGALVLILLTPAVHAFAEEVQTSSTATTAAHPPIVQVTPTVATKAIMPEKHAYFAINPYSDGAIIAGSLTFGMMLELIVSTGEIRPQEPINAGLLLGIDRPFALTAPKTSGAMLSNIAAGIVVTYAFTDIALTAASDRVDSAWTYGVLYLETYGLHWVISDLVKIAVRRPRPKAYRELRETGMASTITDDALSFYSGHTSITAALSATATYLAFSRDPFGPIGYCTLTGGVLVTGFVAAQRIRAREHFPTDVIAGAVAGAAIGVLVPHLHRYDDTNVSITPAIAPGGGPSISAVGRF